MRALVASLTKFTQNGRGGELAEGTTVVDGSGRFEATVPVPIAAHAARHAFAFVQERASGGVLGVSAPIALR